MKRAVGLLVALLAAPWVGLAQFTRVGAHAGYLVGDSFLDDDTIGYGVELAVDAADWFEIELAVTRFNDNGAGLDMNVTTVALTPFVRGELAPGLALYAGAGASYSFADVGIELSQDVDVDPAFGFHAAGGLSMVFGDAIEFFGEYRWVSIGFDDPGVEGFDADYSFNMIRGGINLLF